MDVAVLARQRDHAAPSADDVLVRPGQRAAPVPAGPQILPGAPLERPRERHPPRTAVEQLPLPERTHAVPCERPHVRLTPGELVLAVALVGVLAAHALHGHPQAVRRLDEDDETARPQHAVDLGEQPVLVGDVMRELLHQRHAERRVGERQERRVADDPLARAHAGVLVEAAEPEGVGLEVDHPRVVARLGEQPAAPARPAADVDEPVAGRRGAELPDEVDDVDEPRRADPQELDVLVDVLGRALPDALLLHRLLDPVGLGRVVAHVDQVVADGIQQVGGGGPEAVVTRLQWLERPLAAQRGDRGGGQRGREHARHR